MAVQLPALSFQGTSIGDRGEMLSLTDMWRAAGGDLSKQPAKWRELPATREFVSHLAEVTLRKSEDEVFEVDRGGRRPGTWAHWHIALAYAKYLDPRFHVWCNEVVRARMEQPLTARPEPAGPPAVAAAFKGFFGIGRLIGLDRNQSALAANRATVSVTGVDPLALMGATHLLAPVQEHTLTATEIGRELGGRSAIAANHLLAERGLQVGKRDAKDRAYWQPTEAGMSYARLFDTGKRHGDGTPVAQVKWLRGVLDALRPAGAVEQPETAS